MAAYNALITLTPRDVGIIGKSDIWQNSYYRCRSMSCINSDAPQVQYHRQKVIQNTVRVPQSIYTMNLGALSVYQSPQISDGVNWKQMSDRRNPHVAIATVSSHGSSTKSSITRERPGSLTPGGVGVDMKHNSYDRYLARIKGKSVLRRGIIPPGYGLPIPFNRAFPVYGGKVVKTGIVNGCDCPQKLEPVLEFIV